MTYNCLEILILSLGLFRNMELKSYRPYQPYHIFLNMVMEGVHSQLYLI